MPPKRDAQRFLASKEAFWLLRRSVDLKSTVTTCLTRSGDSDEMHHSEDCSDEDKCEDEDCYRRYLLPETEADGLDLTILFVHRKIHRLNPGRLSSPRL